MDELIVIVTMAGLGRWWRLMLEYSVYTTATVQEFSHDISRSVLGPSVGKFWERDYE